MRVPKRFHRKSRLGCLTCKQRRVKCDEGLPACTHCVDFGITCVYKNDGCNAVPQLPLRSQQRRTGPGRPRKNWGPVTVLMPHVSDLCLDADQAALLHHFQAHTASTLVGSRDPADPLRAFWTTAVPQLGIAHPFVLRFALALAACHLTHLRRGNNSSSHDEANLPRLASRQLCVGVAEMNKALATGLQADNCGAILTASMLVASCAFAAGPRSPRDVLLGHLDGDTASILGLVRGNRAIQETAHPQTLWSGLLQPLDPNNTNKLKTVDATASGNDNDDDDDDKRPSCLVLNLPPITNWTQPLSFLQTLISQHSDHSAQDRIVLLTALNHIILIYEAVYGRHISNHDDHQRHTIIPRVPAHYKMVLIFLYLVQDDFVTRVHQQQPLALLVLAYYAPLLNADPNDWHIRPWAAHIIRAVENLLPHEYIYLLEWPRQVILDSAEVESRRRCVSDSVVHLRAMKQNLGR